MKIGPESKNMTEIYIEQSKIHKVIESLQGVPKDHDNLYHHIIRISIDQQAILVTACARNTVMPEVFNILAKEEFINRGTMPDNFKKVVCEIDDPEVISDDKFPDTIINVSIRENEKSNLPCYTATIFSINHLGCKIAADDIPAYVEIEQPEPEELSEKDSRSDKNIYSGGI